MSESQINYIYIMYYLPTVLCLVYYVLITIRNYNKDKCKRKGSLTYIPTDDYGDLFVRVMISVLPVVNILVTMFCIIPDTFSGVFLKVNKFMQKPVVPVVTEYNKGDTK